MNLHVTFSLSDDVQHLMIECDGDLALQGEMRDNIRVEYPKGNTQPQLEPADAGMRLIINSDARVQLPSNMPLTIAKLGGDLVVNNAQAAVRVTPSAGDTALQQCGDVTLNNVHGDLAANHVGSVSATAIHGDFAVKHGGRVSVDKINGDFAANHCAAIMVSTIHGDCALNHVAQEIRVDMVGGDAVINNTAGSVHIDRVGGDVIFRGSITPGNSVRIRAGGDMTVNISGPAAVHTMSGHEFPGWDEIRAQPASDDSVDGAEVLLAAAGELLFTGEGDIRIPGFSLFERMPAPPMPPIPPAPPSPVGEDPAAAEAQERTPAASGISEDETLKVLRMVQEGKISPEEGDMLLDALSK